MSISTDKRATIRVCENILYLTEKRGIKYISSVERVLEVSNGYLAKCLARPNKKISVDTTLKASEMFGVKVEDLINLDLRQY